MDVPNRPGYLIDLPGELALYAVGFAGALTVYSDVPGIWGRPASVALAVAVGIAAVRWLARPPTRSRLARYPSVILVGLAAAAAVVGFVTNDPSALGWTLAGIGLVGVPVLVPARPAVAARILLAPMFVLAGGLLVALAIAPLPDGNPMPKAYAIFGAAMALAASSMVREGLRSTPTMLLILGMAFLVAGVILLPDRTLGLAPLTSVLAGAFFAGLGAYLLHTFGTWRRLWLRWRALFHQSRDS